MNQVELNRKGQAYIAGLQAASRKLWELACKADGIEPTASFVVFSDYNRAARLLNQCRLQLVQAQADYRNGGYVGLRIVNGRAI